MAEGLAYRVVGFGLFLGVGVLFVIWEFWLRWFGIFSLVFVVFEGIKGFLRCYGYFGRVVVVGGVYRVRDIE